MSKDYGIKIELATKATPHALEKIIQRGIGAGLLYLGYDDDLLPTSEAISSDKLLEHLNNMLHMPRKKKSGWSSFPSLFAQFEEKSIHLVIGEEKGCLGILLTRWGPHWRRNDEPGLFYYVDFDKYIRLLLDLCQDFPILELSTYDSDRE